MNAPVKFDEATLAKLPAEDLAYLTWQMEWSSTARPDQIPPEDGWTECGYQCGRGYGKTRVGAEWLGRAVYEDPSGFDSAVICPTFSDVKFTAFEGESGILSVIPPDLVLEHNKSDMTIRMRNVAGGSSLIRGFSAEKPERLRGPQHCRGWLDEVAAWQNDEATWDMYMFGLRLGSNPQTLWTSTPKPREMIRRITAQKPGRVIVHGGTYDNRANLAATFFEQIEQYDGTKIGRQELYGELIDPEEAGVVQRGQLRLWPHGKHLPAFDMIVMSLDTAFTEKTTRKGDPDPTACSVWGVFRMKNMGHAMLLDCWQDHLGFMDLMRRVKKELGFRYGDDQDVPIIRPLISKGGDRPVTSGRKPDMLIIEDKGSGISLRQALAESGIDAFAYNPGRADKLARLHIVSPMFSARRVWVPESGKMPGQPVSWAEPLLAQLCTFAGEGSIRHDDYVDTTTQCLRVMMDMGLLDLVKRREEPEDDGPWGRPLINPYAQ